MKKLSDEVVKLNTNNNVESSLKREYNKSLKDDDFKLLVKKIPLEEEYIMKYTSKLNVCVLEHKNCRDCSHILECQNEVRGFVFTPEVKNKGINFGYIACKYKQKLLKDNKYQQNIYYFDIPIEIKEARMKDIDKSEKDRYKVISWLKDFYINYQKNKKQKGLYLYGNFGSGKTYLISAMFNEIAKKDIKVAIIYWSEFLRDLKASFSDDFGSKFNYIKKIPLLLIDDIGAENATPWARDEILGPILQYRMQENLSTFFTSNLSLEELEIHFSNSQYKVDKLKAKRIIERIKQMSEEIKMISKNNRK